MVSCIVQIAREWLMVLTGKPISAGGTTVFSAQGLTGTVNQIGMSRLLG